MQKAMEERYPETEGDKPPEERKGTIPPSLAKQFELQEKARVQRELERGGGSPPDAETGRALPQSSCIIETKNATPGDGARDLEECFENIRPKGFTLDRSTAASTTPADIRGLILQRCPVMIRDLSI